MLSNMRYLIVTSLLLSCIKATPIPNGIVGAPEVDCGLDTIKVVFNLQAPFTGRLYVKGYANDPLCSKTESGLASRTVSIEINKNECGVTKLRTLNPPGLTVNVKAVIQFHPRVVTKVDKAFDIMCVYMQSFKTVTYPVSVSMIPLNDITEKAEQPRCKYEVLDGGPNGKPAKTVTIGQALYHKWSCDSSYPDLWCMTVYNCQVDDGTGTSIEILNADGCAVDKYILQNLEYQSNLMAGQEAHAFKFADRVVVNFQCSIRIDLKPEATECPRPKCTPLVVVRKSVSLANMQNRSHHVFDYPPTAEVDVRMNSITVLNAEVGENIREQSDERLRQLLSQSTIVRSAGFVCLSTWQICIPAALLIFLLIMVTWLSCAYWRRPTKGQL